MSLLVEYLSFACTGTGQATFYNIKQEQENILKDLHAIALGENRRIYALSGLLPMNDRSKQMVLFNLLASGKQTQAPELEWRAIESICGTLPFNRTLNLLLEIKEKGINNSRTRRLGAWLWKRYGDAYRVIKYRAKFRALLRHCHIPEGKDPGLAELHRWLFDRVRDSELVEYNPMLKARLAAVKDYDSLFALPFDIAKDMAICLHNQKADTFTQEFASRGRLTRKEELRAQATAGIEVNYRKFTLLELLRHLYAHPEESTKIAPLLTEKANSLASKLTLLPKVALVIDNSLSTSGSAQRAYYPVAVIEAIARVLLAVKTSEVTAYYTGEPFDGTRFKPQGATPLREPLVQALVARPDLIIILSDGYENIAAGSVAQIVNTKAVKASQIGIVHLNPVAAAESMGTKKLADSIPSLGISNLEQLPLLTLLVQAYQQPQLLEAFFDRVETALFKGGDPHVAKLIKGITNDLTAECGEHDDVTLSTVAV
jgi:hypothetical protein